jgi:ABC-type Fe2+-enterobactin transport system substrate-binding protein
MLPSELITQLAELTQENRKGAEALYAAEVKLAEAEHELDTVEQRAFISAIGTVADRTALARLESADVRLQRDLRKAEANRVRMKIKGLESALMAVATQAKLVTAEARI